MAADLNTVERDSSLRKEFEALTPVEFDALKRTGAYYRLLAKMRFLALSALALCVCSWIFYFNFFTIIHVLVNLLIVGVSLRAIIRPSTNGALALGFALLVIGSWNLFCTFYIGLAVFNIILAGIGILQLLYAVQAYWAYQRYSLLISETPNKELRQKYEAIWRSISKPVTTANDDVLSLEINTNQHWWEGLYKQNQIKPIVMLLLPGQAIMAYKNRKWLEFAPKSETVIEIGSGYKITVSETVESVQNLKKFSSKQLNRIGVFIRFANEVFSGYIQPTHLQKYIDWKQVNDPQTMMTDFFANERQVQMRIRKSILIAIVCYVFLAIVVVIFTMQYFPQA